MNNLFPRKHDSSSTVPWPYVCNSVAVNPYSEDATVGYSGVIQGLSFHPGHRDSTGAVISEPYWELSSYDSAAFHTGIGHYSDQLAHPKISPTHSVAGLHQSNANAPFASVDSQLLGYDGDNLQQMVGHFFVASFAH